MMNLMTDAVFGPTKILIIFLENIEDFEIIDPKIGNNFHSPINT